MSEKRNLNKDLGVTTIDRRGKRWGKVEWIRNYWLSRMKNPLPEPYSIRQVFYEELPNIISFIRNKAPNVLENYPNWTRDFHQSMISLLSDMVLEDVASYRKINLFEDSGANKMVYQDRVSTLPSSEQWKTWVEYPIEVWVENNATYNSLRKMFNILPPDYEKPLFQINLVSQKGFGKTQEIERVKLDRKEDVKVILNLTDFDPSGYSMPRELQERFESIGLNIIVEHIGILPNQIPAQKRTASIVTYKRTDPRNDWFKQEFKDDPLVQKGYGYEIQALNPSEIRALVKDAIENTIKSYGFQRKTSN